MAGLLRRAFAAGQAAIPLRDWLAGLAMQALIPAYYGGLADAEKVARDAYGMADAMLEGGRGGREDRDPG